MNAYLAELIGTAIIIVIGAGVVANVVLSKTKGASSGWIVITWGWAIGVFAGVFVSQDYSGAHLNPAVTVALAMAGKFSWASVPGYMAAQLIGAFFGAVIIGVFYGEHFKVSDDLNAKLTTEDRLLSERVTKLESERGLVGKTLAILAGGGAGLFSGWIGKHL